MLHIGVLALLLCSLCMQCGRSAAAAAESTPPSSPPPPPPRKPSIASVELESGTSVSCGGQRVWTCDARHNYSMVPAEDYKAPPNYHIAPQFKYNEFTDDYVHEEPTYARRFQRELYLYALQLAKKHNYNNFVNFYESNASRTKAMDLLMDGVIFHGIAVNRDPIVDLQFSVLWCAANDDCVWNQSADVVETDLVLLSDNLLETLRNPDALLRWIKVHVKFKRLIIAMEPRVPANRMDCTRRFYRRQWTLEEMKQYLTSEPHALKIGTVAKGTVDKVFAWIVVESDAPEKPKEHYMLGEKVIEITSVSDGDGDGSIHNDDEFK